MTDNEIIKALECCTTQPSCDGCPYEDTDEACYTDMRLYKDALDLINRQKAEINKLTYQVNRLKKYDEERDIRLHARLTATAKAEAIKEIASDIISFCETRIVFDHKTDEIMLYDYINYLVKEKVGE